MEIGDREAPVPLREFPRLFLCSYQGCPGRTTPSTTKPARIARPASSRGKWF